MDPSIFIPERRDQTTTDAKRVCASCPVRDECLEYGMYEPFGVWGGKTINERRRIRAARRSVKHPARCGTPSGYNRHRALGEKACVACHEANSAAQRERNAERRWSA